MRYIPLKEANKEALEAWLKKSNEILDEMKNEPDAKKRKAIIHRNKAHWRDTGLLEFLKKLSDGKCWYTEAKFTAEYPHLEHFRPKSCARDEDWAKCHDGYWWLAFDIENYRLSKPVPNTRKGTYFPLLDQDMAVRKPGVAVTRESPLFLDPTNQEDVDLISFNAFGQPEPCSNPIVDLNEWDLKRIEFSIQRYGLDDRDLCDERKELWVSLTAQFNEYAKLLMKYKSEQCLVSKGKAEEKLQALEAPSNNFTGSIKACFEAHKVGQLLLKRLASFPMAA
jgi:hypothetical protein